MKKKNSLKLTTVTFCLLSVIGCKNPPKGETIFKPIAIAEQVHLTADTISPACSININLNYAESEDSVAYYINKEIVKAAFEYENLSPETAVDSFVAHYTRSYTHDLLPYYGEDKEAGKEGMGWYNYFYDLKTDAQKGKEGIFNYTIEMNSYEGGAHGNQVSTYLNFYTESGKLVTLDDLFVPGYETSLNEILLKALMQQAEVTTMEALQEKGYLMWTSMYPSKNFLLKSDGIDFLYNAYEIAPYVVGVTVLKIPYEALTDVLKK